MTFPANPSDYDEHDDSGARYYALGGMWSRRRIPEVTFAHNSDADNYQMFIGSSIAHPSQMLIMECVFTTKSDTEIHALLYDNSKGAWVPKAKMEDASGLIHWGSAATQGKLTSDFDRASWGGTSFIPYVRDSTRVLKAGYPQFFRLVFLRAGINQTVVAWEFHSTTVTGGALCKNYGKMNVTLDLINITSVALVAYTGNFDDISFTAEVY